MSNVNWGRLLIGGILASMIAFITDGLLHEMVLQPDWQAVYTALGVTHMPQEHGSHMIYFALFELGRGLVSIFMYVMMREHLTPGPKTAVLAGLVAWFAFCFTGPAQFIPLGFLSNTLWGKMAAAQLVTSVIAALAGAALYKPRESQA